MLVLAAIDDNETRREVLSAVRHLGLRGYGVRTGDLLDAVASYDKVGLALRAVVLSAHDPNARTLIDALRQVRPPVPVLAVGDCTHDTASPPGVVCIPEDDLTQEQIVMILNRIPSRVPE